jgi:hypothetical protein
MAGAKSEGSSVAKKYRLDLERSSQAGSITVKGNNIFSFFAEP